MTTQVTVDGFTVKFGGLTAVDDISFTLESGSIFGLIGPNGAGKSTVINGVTGYLPEATGRIRYSRDGSVVDLSPLSTHDRCRLGIVRTFQTPRLIAGLTVAENVALGVVARDMRQRWFELFGAVGLRNGTRRRFADAVQALETLGLESLARQDTAALSLGEQRLVEIARAAVSGARVLLLDEPFAGLSTVEQTRVADEIANLREAGIAIMLVEHHLDHVRALADVVVAMDQGAEFLRGGAAEVLDSAVVRERYLGESVS